MCERKLKKNGQVYVRIIGRFKQKRERKDRCVFVQVCVCAGVWWKGEVDRCLIKSLPSQINFAPSNDT